MKRLVVCCDGTWQKLANSCPTNVVKIAQAIKPVASDGTPQIVFYDEGIGTGDEFNRITGGAFGWGIDQNIQDAYRFLCLNYEVGDEIYLFGFSRGAYTVRSLAGLLAYSGLLERPKIRKAPEAYENYRHSKDPHHAKPVEFRKENSYKVEGFANRVPIKLLGCWDTVGQLGVPDQFPLLPFDQWINEKYRFHDTTLSSIIQHARHAVAIDEIRKVFDVTLMQKSLKSESQDLRQVWFPGDHGCVGGGTKEHFGLSNAALQWMMDEVSQLVDNSSSHGLEFEPTKVEAGLNCDYKTKFTQDQNWIYILTGKKSRDIVGNFDTDIHESVKKRWRDVEEYRPQNLKKMYKQQLNNWEETSIDVIKTTSRLGARQ